MIDFEEHLRERLHDAASTVTTTPALATEVERRIDRRPRGRIVTQRRALVAAITAIAVVAAGISVSGGAGDRTTSLAKATPRTGEPGWAVLAPPLLGARYQHAAVWMDGEILVFGGHRGGGAASGAELYDPASGRWRQVSEPPGDMGSPTAAWTGEVVLALDFEGRLFAYDPAADRWSERASSPLVTGANGATDVTWTGTELLALYSGDQETPASPLVSYDPGSDRWGVKAELPGLRQTEELFWTGTEVIVTVNHASGRGAGGTDLWSYSESDGWRQLPEPPLARWASRMSPYVTWTGAELVVGGGWALDEEGAALSEELVAEDRGPTADEEAHLQLQPRVDVAAWDPTQRAWRSLPDAPEPTQSAGFRYATVWTGDEIVTWQLDAAGEYTGEILLLHPATGAWRRGGDAPRGIHAETPATWTGREMVIVSGETAASGTPPMECCEPEPVAVAFTP
jgi:hypothetical protein